MGWSSVSVPPVGWRSIWSGLDYTPLLLPPSIKGFPGSPEFQTQLDVRDPQWLSKDRLKVGPTVPYGIRLTSSGLPLPTTTDDVHSLFPHLLLFLQLSVLVTVFIRARPPEPLYNLHFALSLPSSFPLRFRRSGSDPLILLPCRPGNPPPP